MQSQRASSIRRLEAESHSRGDTLFERAFPTTYNAISALRKKKKLNQKDIRGCVSLAFVFSGSKLFVTTNNSCEELKKTLRFCTFPKKLWRMFFFQYIHIDFSKLLPSPSLNLLFCCRQNPAVTPTVTDTQRERVRKKTHNAVVNTKYLPLISNIINGLLCFVSLCSVLWESTRKIKIKNTKTKSKVSGELQPQQQQNTIDILTDLLKKSMVLFGSFICRNVNSNFCAFKS